MDYLYLRPFPKSMVEPVGYAAMALVQICLGVVAAVYAVITAIQPDPFANAPWSSPFQPWIVPGCTLVALLLLHRGLRMGHVFLTFLQTRQWLREHPVSAEVIERFWKATDYSQWSMTDLQACTAHEIGVVIPAHELEQVFKTKRNPYSLVMNLARAGSRVTWNQYTQKFTPAKPGLFKVFGVVRPLLSRVLWRYEAAAMVLELQLEPAGK